MTRKNSLTRQVRAAYSQDTLQRICTLREDRFGRAFGMETVHVDQRPSPWLDDADQEDYYHFRDNGSRVLAVAHLDTVVRKERRVARFRETAQGPLIISGSLDDRLGAYVILDLLPKMGVTCDWLFTVGEESGQSTAEHFKPGKDYDWVIEFDRGGTDVVMYQYEDLASRRLVEAAGARMGGGSYSDIAYLEHLGVKAFNWGVGYDGNYHSEAGYAYLNNTFAMVAKYLRFHDQNAGTTLAHDAQGGRYGSRYDDGYYGKDEYYRCDNCGEKAVDSVTWYCTFCGICADCGATDPDVAADWNDPDVDVCQCYTPEQRGTRDADNQDWRTVDWKDYCKQRPAGPDETCPDCGKDAVDECTCPLDAEAEHPVTCRCVACMPVRRSPSLAPPWSEHRPDVSHGLGVPTGRKTGEPGNGAAGWLTAGLSEDLVAAVTAHRDRSAVNPPAVFPDADMGWHEAARHGADGLYVVAHQPGQAWAQICLRCAARWPHPVSGSADIHPESDCSGCDRCGGGTMIATGAIHVIPAHLAGDSDICRMCQAWSAALNEIDRGDAPAQRAAMRALDEQEADDALA